MNKLKAESILVTGGTGSFGKAFVKTILANHHEVKRLVVFSRDGVKREQLELADGPGITFGLSVANGKVWLSDATTTPMEFKAYDVLK